MILAVNTRMLLKDRMEGIGYFSYETLKRITQKHPEHQFIFIFDRPYSDEFIFGSNITPVVAFPPARHPLLWYWWFEYSIPKILKRHRPDIFISHDGYLPLRDHTPSLAVIHDINFEHYPADLPFSFRKYYKHYFPRFSRKADRIATVSEFSKKDISVHYEIPSDKIDVVYNGANENFKPYPQQCIENIRKQLTGGHPYFLFVGSLHQRKNVVNQLKAFDQFKKSSGSPMYFVFAGSKRWWTQGMETAFQSMEFKHHVLFIGRVTEQQLYDYTACAFAAVYVSNFEGFGIPIIEAMQCRVPVITSNITAMPEIAGEAALLADPFSATSIAETMTRLYQDESLRKNLIEAGEKRAKDFGWNKTADLLWESLMKIAT